jgi:hypothetical protein
MKAKTREEIIDRKYSKTAAAMATNVNPTTILVVDPHLGDS